MYAMWFLIRVIVAAVILRLHGYDVNVSWIFGKDIHEQLEATQCIIIANNIMGPTSDFIVSINFINTH